LCILIKFIDWESFSSRKNQLVIFDFFGI